MLTRATESLIETLTYPGGFISPLTIEEAVTRALAEDLGRAGDVTSIATVPAGTASRTVLAARKGGTIAGLPLAVACFRKLSSEIEIVPVARDGATVEAKAALMRINGDARAVLSAERVALNFVQHLSGIATATQAFVRKVGTAKTRICCTRKTTPGLRSLEKYAVRCGGGFNHRFGLDDAILIKDNHIAVAGGIRPVLERARANAGHLVKIEIEVDSLEQLADVLESGLADVVLIDNFDTATMNKAMAMVNGRVVVEASGGITLDTIADIAATGVNYASSGALTHSAPALDVGLDIEM
jgi:nicotinate-nucleotide pyrophosphorylase (carboxylating)